MHNQSDIAKQRAWLYPIDKDIAQCNSAVGIRDNIKVAASPLAFIAILRDCALLQATCCSFMDLEPIRCTSHQAGRVRAEHCVIVGSNDGESAGDSRAD